MRLAHCVYHGWKFDSTGACVDMPSEPPDSLFKTKVTIKAYPTFEAADVIWTYMGPPELMPAKPDYEWMRAPRTHRFVSKTFEDANYLQGLEGGLDTAHSSFAHNERLGDRNWIRNRDGAPRLDVERTDYGYTYISTRNVGEDGQYIRVYHYVMPAQQMRGSVTALTGGRAKVPKLDGHIWVPIDDEHTYVYNWALSYSSNDPITPEYAEDWESQNGRGVNDLIPGTFKLKKARANDYMIDRERQRTKTFTGIVGINTQDFALQEGMGNVVDRSLEHLGTSDKAIIVTRQLMLEATDRVASGEPLRAIEPSTYRNVRPYDDYVPEGADWREQFAQELVGKMVDLDPGERTLRSGARARLARRAREAVMGDRAGASARRRFRHAVHLAVENDGTAGAARDRNRVTRQCRTARAVAYRSDGARGRIPHHHQPQCRPADPAAGRSRAAAPSYAGCAPLRARRRRRHHESRRYARANGFRRPRPYAGLVLARTLA